MSTGGEPSSSSRSRLVRRRFLDSEESAEAGSRSTSTFRRLTRSPASRARASGLVERLAVLKPARTGRPRWSTRTTGSEMDPCTMPARWTSATVLESDAPSTQTAREPSGGRSGSGTRLSVEVTGPAPEPERPASESGTTPGIWMAARIAASTSPDSLMVRRRWSYRGTRRSRPPRSGSAYAMAAGPAR